ncbi:DUF7426 family protein [Leifsonia naganoensis]|uniref:DUF7426 domain-containing protein n=1 Tax=Leifsonia naganoensis TaxID=150025 RepID=A0A853DQE7_9MICO|nr:hypothetical protein [Leifsonia naganoensis]NYK08571.1 hypothetical protein [Leifsonia naganoensis]
MAFADYAEFLEPLVLPIRGKKYTIPPISLEAGLTMSTIAEGGKSNLTDDEFNRLVLGATYEEMRADAVSEDAILRAVLTAWAEYKSGRVAAELIWKTGGDPKALQAQVELLTNRATKRKASKPSPSTGAANTTKRPASTSGTRKSPKK